MTANEVGELEFRTVGLDHELDFFALGAASGLLWSSNGHTLIGLGNRHRMSATQTALAALPGHDDIKQPGSGPVGFAALAFDPERPKELVVPELVMVADSEGNRWVTVVRPGASQLDDSAISDLVIEHVDAMSVSLRPVAVVEPGQLTVRTKIPPEVWRDKIVTEARDRILDGLVNKVVLARELTVEADVAFDRVSIMSRLADVFPSANLFMIDGFFGASPETLITRLGDVVSAHPLAGTSPRATDPDRDRQLADDLLASDKNRWEHRITIDWLLDTLLPFCSYVDAEPEPSLMSLANVHHLGTRVEGRLSAPAASVLDLVTALHPTPAVGGEPQAAALAMITELEQADRGRYAGPTGWVDAAGNGRFAVSVRSAQFDSPEHVTLFAGVGVVGDSDPQAELDETRAKCQAVLGALLRP